MTPMLQVLSFAASGAQAVKDLMVAMAMSGNQGADLKGKILICSLEFTRIRLHI